MAAAAGAEVGRWSQVLGRQAGEWRGSTAAHHTHRCLVRSMHPAPCTLYPARSRNHQRCGDGWLHRWRRHRQRRRHCHRTSRHRTSVLRSCRRRRRRRRHNRSERSGRAGCQTGEGCGPRAGAECFCWSGGWHSSCRDRCLRACGTGGAGCRTPPSLEARSDLVGEEERPTWVEEARRRREPRELSAAKANAEASAVQTSSW